MLHTTRRLREPWRTNKWYVYFLRLANGHVYVGSSNDLRRRIESHRKGSVVSTRRHLPAELISYIAVGTEAGARALERYFKSGSGKAFARKRLCNDPAKPEDTASAQVLVPSSPKA